MDKRKQPHSEEHKRKISESQKALGERHWAKKPETIKKRVAARAALKRAGWVDPKKGRKRPDITGKNHYLWNGKTPLYEQIRKCLEYRNWRSFVFERDNYTCTTCGESGVYIHADHIKQFAFVISENNIKTFEEALECKELWDVKNGRTLCVPCHRRIPVYTYDGTRKIIFNKS